MGFLSDLLGKSAPTQNSLQQEGNQMMLKMMQDRLAASTCPTERQQLQNNIAAIQRANQLNQTTVANPSPIITPQNPAPIQPQRPEFQWLDQELSRLKDSVKTIEEFINKLKSS